MEEQVGQVGTRDKILRGERKTRKGGCCQDDPGSLCWIGLRF